MLNRLNSRLRPPEQKTSRTACLIALESELSCEARFLSVNENRLATGYRPVDGGDVFQPPK